MKNVRRMPRASFDMPFDLKRFLLLQFHHESFFVYKETGVLRLIKQEWQGLAEIHF